MPTFAELGVAAPIVESLTKAGIIEAFPIQAMCIPQALEGRDLIGQAKTGTGKTLAFGIPILQRIAAPELGESGEASPHGGTGTGEDAPRGQGAGQGRSTSTQPGALVVVPTRELCLQVTSDLTQAGAALGARVTAIYGGRPYEAQIEALQGGVDVVVGTPGRLLDLARQRHLNLKGIRALVLDEADEMLDMGFLPDVERIVSLLPATRQTMLFSATMPGQIIALGRRYMTTPTHIRAINPNDESATVDAIEQHVWRVHPLNKVEILARILQASSHGPCMIFCRTKRRAQAVADELAERGFASGAVHGDLGQGAREQALRAFRNGKIDVLVATDVAARGIDVEGITHVVNYECPDDEKTYLHRIGRTGRAGASGVAVTFVDWEDIPRWSLINKALGLAFHEPLETYHTSDHLFTGLGIPKEVSGRLPRAERTKEGLAAERLEDFGGKPPGQAKGGKERRGHSKHHGQTIGHGQGGHSQGGHSQGGHGQGGHAAGGHSPANTAGSTPEPERKPRRKRSRKRTRGGRDVPEASGTSDARQAPSAGGGSPSGDAPGGAGSQSATDQ